MQAVLLGGCVANILNCKMFNSLPGFYPMNYP